MKRRIMRRKLNGLHPETHLSDLSTSRPVPLPLSKSFFFNFILFLCVNNACTYLIEFVPAAEIPEKNRQ